MFSQHELLSSEREDLAARLETLQSNAMQLETQILETQKLKSALERDLEAERILREQKSKVQTPSDTHLSLSLSLSASVRFERLCFVAGASVCGPGDGGAPGSAQQTQTAAPANVSGARAAAQGKIKPPADSQTGHHHI